MAPVHLRALGLGLLFLTTAFSRHGVAQAAADDHDRQTVSNILEAVAAGEPLPLPGEASESADGDSRPWSEAQTSSPFKPDTPSEDAPTVPREQDEWIAVRTYFPHGDHTKRPGKEMLQRIRVQWGHPRLNLWTKLLIMRGRLHVMQDGPSGDRPVDWFQGVAVHMGMQSEQRYDWSRGAANDESLTSVTVVGEDGRFSVAFDLTKEPAAELRAHRRQFALSLAIHRPLDGNGQRVVWSSIAPMIPASTKMLEIEHGPQRSDELELIHRAATWPRSKDAGVDLIRAVNALHRLGKQQALKTLERYIELTYGNPSVDEHDELAVVSWILLVLFKPAQVDDPPPAPNDADRRPPAQANSPTYPLVVQDNIPFLVGTRRTPAFAGGGLGGGPPAQWSHIRWYRKNGVLRERPLHPRGDPVLAAASLLRSPQFKLLDEDARQQATRSVRLQAISMVAAPLELFRIRSTEDPELGDRSWHELVERAKKSGVRWSSTRQAFVK